MNIYEDYKSYMNEHASLLKKLNEHNSKILICILDVIKVTDYIYQKFIKNEFINEEEKEIFDIGYGYLSNVLNDLNTFYEDYFDNNINEFEKRVDLIMLAIYVDDYVCYLENNEYMNDGLKEELKSIAYKLDNMLANKTIVDEQIVKNIESHVLSLSSYHNDFRPVYLIFSMMIEELQIY